MKNQILTNVHPKAKIGKNVIIEPFATVYEDVVIGDNCWIASNVVIMNGARIGNNCKIYPGAIISAESQDLKYNGEYAVTEIGDNTTIREYVTIHKGTADKKTTKIGSNCLLMSYVHVAHDCIVGDNVVIRLRAESRESHFLLNMDSRSKSLKNNEEIFISKADFSIKLIELPDHNFLKTIRNKLFWGKDSRN